jgi:hypothetical protein
MSIIIDGTGTISGVSATGLTTAQNVGYAQLPTGSVLQVQSTTKTDTFSIASSSTFADITGLTVSITPKFSTSKILIIAYIGGSSFSNGGSSAYRFARNGTLGVGVGVASGSRQGTGFRFPNGAGGDSNLSYGGLSMNFLDSPATTSATTYSVQLITQNLSAGTAYINASQGDVNTAESYGTRSACTITVMEIAG